MNLVVAELLEKGIGDLSEAESFFAVDVDGGDGEAKEEDGVALVSRHRPACRRAGLERR